MVEKVTIQTMSAEIVGRSRQPEQDALVRPKKEAVASTVATPESIAAVPMADVQADQTPVPQYTQSELDFQRWLIPEKKAESKSGDAAKRIGINSTVFLTSTGADLAESHLVDAVWRRPMHRWLTATRERGPKFTESARKVQGVHFAGEFIEEWASDTVYKNVANKWAAMMTGDPKVKYVSETSEFMSDWMNVVSQVWLSDKFYPTKFVGHDGKPMTGLFGIKKAYQTMDFMNPVNVEAALRLMEELPVLGRGVTWLHKKTDHMLETSKARLASSFAAKGVLGYHIGRNVKPL